MVILFVISHTKCFIYRVEAYRCMNRVINSRAKYLGVVKTTPNTNIVVGEPPRRGKTEDICNTQLVIEIVDVVLEVGFLA